MVEGAIWNGAITFGLVTMQVTLHAATLSEGISFKQIHKKDGVVNVKSMSIGTKSKKALNMQKVSTFL